VRNKEKAMVEKRKKKKSQLQKLEEENAELLRENEDLRRVTPTDNDGPGYQTMVITPSAPKMQTNDEGN
jgi:hypothetical protein